jgi:catechol 2,3-dioxygenase-like lactoylglutathione lyase family enzyme
MFFGTHLLLYSRDAEADRAFLRDVLEIPAVDAGEGWLIFALPPAEMGVHPGESEIRHAESNLAGGTVYLMCRDLRATMDKLKAKGVQCGAVHEAGWGVVTSIPLPGGSSLGLYEPRHPLAIDK